MINNKKILAVIPARGGSKGIKDKNILNIQGKPLIAYTIEAAKQSIYVDEVMVSTDSEKIKDVAEFYGASIPFLRPAELAKDETATLDVVLHAVNAMQSMGNQYDVLLLLQPTSPLRNTADIDAAIKTFFQNGCKPLVGVSEVCDHPILMRTIGENGNLEHLLPVNSSVRRQDMPLYYKVNGSIYINLICELNEKTSFNDNPVPYVMESDRAVDIDNYLDVMIADYYLKRQKERENAEGECICKNLSEV